MCAREQWWFSVKIWDTYLCKQSALDAVSVRTRYKFPICNHTFLSQLFCMPITIPGLVSAVHFFTKEYANRMLLPSLFPASLSICIPPPSPVLTASSILSAYWSVINKFVAFSGLGSLVIRYKHTCIHSMPSVPANEIDFAASVGNGKRCRRKHWPSSTPH